MGRGEGCDWAGELRGQGGVRAAQDAGNLAREREQRCVAGTGARRRVSRLRVELAARCVADRAVVRTAGAGRAGRHKWSGRSSCR